MDSEKQCTSNKPIEAGNFESYTNCQILLERPLWLKYRAAAIDLFDEYTARLQKISRYYDDVANQIKEADKKCDAKVEDGMALISNKCFRKAEKKVYSKYQPNVLAQIDEYYDSAAEISKRLDTKQITFEDYKNQIQELKKNFFRKAGNTELSYWYARSKWAADFNDALNRRGGEILQQQRNQAAEAEASKDKYKECIDNVLFYSGIASFVGSKSGNSASNYNLCLYNT